MVEAALAGLAPVVRFWYRESGDYLVPREGYRTHWSDPPFEAPGSRLLEMTTDGRLLSLRALPAAPTVNQLTTATDWSVILAAAGLKPSALDPVTPASTPPDFADERKAWLTRPSEPSDMRLRVEAAALDGVPVFFTVAPDLPVEVAAPSAGATTRDRLFYLLLLTLFSFVLAAALWLARRNLIAARADRHGASRVAAVVLAVSLVTWTVSASHAPTLAEFGLFFRELAWMMLAASVGWVFYIALEPLLRRRSPASLVSWTRLFAGRARDPLVGRDLLLGSLLGAALVTSEALSIAWLWKSAQDPVPAPVVMYLFGVPGLFRVAAAAILAAFVLGMGFLVLWQLLSWVLRSSARGAIALGALMLFGQSVANGVGTITFFLLASVVLLVVAFVRLGLLASVAMLWIFHLGIFFPLWTDPAAWFFGESVAVFVLGMLPALWGAWVCTRGSSTVAALS